MTGLLLTAAGYNQELQAGNINADDTNHSVFVIPSQYMPTDRIEVPVDDAKQIKALTLQHFAEHELRDLISSYIVPNPQWRVPA